MDTEHKIRPKYPEIVLHLDIQGEDGNAFVIIGRLMALAEVNGISKEEVNIFRDEATSGNYENLLKVCQRWFHFTYKQV